MAVTDALDEMIERADPTRGDHRHRHRIREGTGAEVEALLCAVAIHGGEQDLAGAERHDLAGVVDGIEAGGRCAHRG